MPTFEQVPIPEDTRRGDRRLTPETEAYRAAVAAGRAVRYTGLDAKALERLRTNLRASARKASYRARFSAPEPGVLVAWAVKLSPEPDAVP